MRPTPTENISGSILLENTVRFLFLWAFKIVYPVKMYCMQCLFSDNIFLKTIFRLFLTACLFMFFTRNVNSQNTLVFSDYVLQSGNRGADHSVYRFLSVAKGVDALVKIKKRSSSDIVVENIDLQTAGHKEAFQPRIGPAGGSISGRADWWMDFEIRFVKSGSHSAVHIRSFNTTIQSIDGDAKSIREYVEVFKAETYDVFVPSLLQISSLPSHKRANDDDEETGTGKRFTGPLNSFLDIDTAATQLMAKMKYKHSHKITVRVGVVKEEPSVCNSAFRLNSFLFTDFDYDLSASLPVTITAFTLSAENKNAHLRWTTSEELNASHYVIQKSADGQNFNDVGILFTESNSSLNKTYHFTDPIAISDPLVHYRLKIVDIDGSYRYSDVRLLKTKVLSNTKKPLIFPNPSAGDLYITLPVAWQQKKVSMEVYNQKGQMIRKQDFLLASQTEILSFGEMPKGIYLVKFSDGTETSSHRIIKY